MAKGRECTNHGWAGELYVAIICLRNQRTDPEVLYLGKTILDPVILRRRGLKKKKSDQRRPACNPPTCDSNEGSGRMASAGVLLSFPRRENPWKCLQEFQRRFYEPKKR